MDGILNSIGNLLWFLYRTLFALIPTLFLILFSLYFTAEFYPPYQEKLKNLYLFLGNSISIAVLLTVAIILNSIIEAVMYLVIFRYFDFAKIAETVLYNKPIFKKLKDKLNARFNESLQIENLLESFNDYSHLTNVKIAEEKKELYILTWYQISKQYFLYNLTFILVILYILFLPICLAQSQWEVVLFVAILNFFLVIFSAMTNKYWLSQQSSIVLPAAKIQWWFWTIPLLLVMGMGIAAIATTFQWGTSLLFWFSWLASTFLFFSIFTALIFRGFREFLYVQSFQTDFLIQTHFRKEFFNE